MAFSDIVGHARPVKILMGALRSGRLAHAYMFVGPDGVGKATTALNLAKAIHCEGQGVDACDTCAACEKVSRGSHPDVLWIEPEGAQIRIEQIRDLQQRVAYRPLEGSRRCVVLDRAHDMTLPAANALLKVLEEPPEGNVMVLIARSTSVLPPTVVSRCHVICFSPLTAAEVAHCLCDRHGWSWDEALRVSNRSRGSVKTALALRGLPMVAEEERVLHFLAGLETFGIGEVLERSQDWGAGREVARSRLELLMGVFRDLVCLHLGSGTVDRKELQELMHPVASRWRLEELLEGWSGTAEALSGVERNWNPHLLMDRLLLSLHSSRTQGKGARAPEFHRHPA